MNPLHGNRNKVSYNERDPVNLLQALELDLLILPCLNYLQSWENVHYLKMIRTVMAFFLKTQSRVAA